MLFNKRLLQQELNKFEFPAEYDFKRTNNLLDKWQKAIKNGNYESTKETRVQATFLTRFFSNILQYTEIHDCPDEWTLINEAKTEVDTTKADGALGFFSKDYNITRAVIELKDANTSLDKKQSCRKENYTPVEQAFGYLSKFDRCDWVIVSNFKEIRLYHKSRGQGYYEKFEILDLLDPREFKRFYFLLCKDNLIDKNRNSLLDRLVEDTSKTEEEISKEFYQKFKKLREHLFDHVFEHNPGYKKTILIEKTQKLLDRLLFIMFCEDTADLLPKDTLKLAYERGKNSFSEGDERIWNEFKGLFKAIDEGNTRVTPPINAYNGGLFFQDDILNTLIINDVIWDEIIKLSEYNFDSDLNVNVLGHIFEQSLSDLEHFKAQIEGKKVETNKSKRKKEGIYYTPEYVTRYIVEQTVGKYLEEHPDKLESIKILDPACGSGAFLNQAHSYLREQYQAKWEEKISDAVQLKMGEHQNIAETDRSILLNNLYGVDLNDESVDITKLALWLKTAKKTEPLQNLDNNIKCGNSLIDDPEFAGNKAFKWKNEFPEIFNEKKLLPYLITWVTHNSRVSERMIEFGVKKDDPVLFEELSEVKISEFIFDKAQELSFRILAYNVCKDHVHLVLVSTDNERDEVVRQLKGYSSKKYREYLNIDAAEKFQTWAQKYHYTLLDTKEKLVNAIEYVNNNRIKHDLPDNKGLKPLVETHISREPHSSRDSHISREPHSSRDSHISREPHSSRDSHISREPHASCDSHASRDSHISRESHSSRETHASCDSHISREPHSSRETHASCEPHASCVSHVTRESLTDCMSAFAHQYEGGFDVVIGNPPYVRQEFISNIKPFLKENYEVYTGVSDLYVYFFEQGLKLLKDGGYFAFIVANKFIKSNYGKKLTQYLQKNYTIVEIIDFGDLQIFEGATTYPCIITIKKEKPESIQNFKCMKLQSLDNVTDLKREMNDYGFDCRINIDSENWILTDNKSNDLIEKIQNVAKPLHSFELNINRGVLTGFNEAFIIDTATKEELCKKDPKNVEIIKPLLRGRDIIKHGYNWDGLWLIFTRRGIDIDKYPFVKNHLEQFKERLEPKPKDYKGSNWPGRKAGPYQWYEIQDNIAYHEDFEKPKIIYPNMTSLSPFAYDKERFFTNDKCFILTQKKENKTYLKFLTAYLNSNLSKFLIKAFFPELLGGTREIKEFKFKNFPVPEVTKEKQEYFSTKTDVFIDLTNKFTTQIKSSRSFIQTKYNLSKISQKMETFYNLGTNQFIEELKKQKVKLTVKEEKELIEWFKEEQNQILGIQNQINQLDYEINQEVYKLYNLSDKEIQIIEKCVQTL
jgi:REP element-mobilizing transposase RayT/type I restriction-modification system DNA methylase subunit